VAAVESSHQAARSAFGDATVYLERYIRKPRHIEIQVICDKHGNAVHLGERECSIQRRHQKIMEETPSPALTPETRAAMGAAAIRAVTAAGYVNAGTVEFMFSEGEFFFLEVNARLQVEHPITEAVTGVDLVKEQIRVASGMELGFKQGDVTWTGHAIEMRINAEDPTRKFLPNPRRINRWVAPAGPGVRDSALAPTFRRITTPWWPSSSCMAPTAPRRSRARDGRCASSWSPVPRRPFRITARSSKALTSVQAISARASSRTIRSLWSRRRRWRLRNRPSTTGRTRATSPQRPPLWARS